MKRAFTLAEVLITLGIIGVVAAITMPMVVTRYQKQETVNKVKKFYTIMNQVYAQAVVDNGNLDNWNFYNNDNNKIIEHYFKPYMKIEKYNYLNKGNYYILPDGICFNVNLGDQYFHILFDINGNQKPNRVGRDIFIININNNVGAHLFGQYIKSSEKQIPTRNELINGIPINNGADTSCCNTVCSSYKYYNCGALIMHDGWKIAPDYPW